MDVTYRRTAAAGASGFALLIALYDTLAGDLRRAAEAQRSKDLERRAREVKHAIAVMGVLENWIDTESGELAVGLLRFYARLRQKIFEAQVRQSAELFEMLMTEVVGMREVWQRMEDGSVRAEPEILPPVATRGHAGASFTEPEIRRSTWRA